MEEDITAKQTVSILERQLDKTLDQIKQQDLKSAIVAVAFIILFGIVSTNFFLVRDIYLSWYLNINITLLVVLVAGLILIFLSLTKRMSKEVSDKNEPISKISLEYNLNIESFEEFAGNIKDMDLLNYENQLLIEIYQNAWILNSKKQLFSAALFTFLISLVITLIFLISTQF